MSIIFVLFQISEHGVLSCTLHATLCACKCSIQKHLITLTQAKLAARRQRGLQEAARQMEEEAARRFVAEQTRQLAQGGDDSDMTDIGSDLQHKPTVKYAQSTEEQALMREQVSCKRKPRWIPWYRLHCSNCSFRSWSNDMWIFVMIWVLATVSVFVCLVGFICLFVFWDSCLHVCVLVWVCVFVCVYVPVYLSVCEWDLDQFISVYVCYYGQFHVHQF